MQQTTSTLYLDGHWAPSASPATLTVTEAATEQALAVVPDPTGTDIDHAVHAARAARHGPWATDTGEYRAAAIHRFATALRARGPDTAVLASRETGMPVWLSQEKNGTTPAGILDYYAELARTRPASDTRAHPSGTGATVVHHDPVGVVAAIVPWNYPQALAAMKLGPALAAGCTLVVKTAPETALDAQALAHAADEAGLPPGVVNVVPGNRETGRYLVTHPEVDRVAFTGSTSAGRAIAEQCGRLLRPVSLELGGKSPALLTNEADLEDFTHQLPRICLPNNGQTCHANTRILAPHTRYREVLDAVTSTVAALRVGDPLDPDTDIGPLATRQHQHRVLDYLTHAQQHGDQITTGGPTAATQEQGWFVTPTVIADPNPDSPIAQDELFGPVLCVLPYTTDEHALHLANNTPYGLGGSIWTRNHDHGHQLARHLHTGTVGLNTYSLAPNAPFGGVKASGLGRELGPEAIDTYTEPQSLYTTHQP